ncbi:MAG: ABC transporter permease [Euryarchaeota archaeon]|nr:ABC transporter permease [Euryarchaeota archaeon]MDE2044109.1 ABC transporter permease [Thermoplasmata archaeon]
MPRERLRAIWALVSLNGLLPLRRQPLFLLNTLTSPFSFLFLIYVVSGGKLVADAVEGGMVLTVLSIGTSLQTDLTHYKQDLKFHEMAVASPVSAGTYVVGLALSEFVYSLPGMVIFVILSFFYAHYIFLGGLIVFGTLILIWIFASSLGFTLATYLADVRETFAVSPLISIGLTVIPPVYYPMSALAPWPWLQVAAQIAPTTWAANLVKGAMGLAPLSFAGGVEAVLILLASAGLLFLTAWKKAQWRES